MIRRKAEALIPCLFEIPSPAEPLPATMDYRAAVSHLVGEVLRATPVDRHAVAAEMSRLSGREISKYMLDAYASEGREEFNMPFCLAPVLEAACESHAFTRWLADLRGGRLLLGRDALNAEIGRLERVKDEASKKIRDLKRIMGDTE